MKDSTYGRRTRLVPVGDDATHDALGRYPMSTGPSFDLSILATVLAVALSACSIL